ITGNLIGTNAKATAPLGNAGDGINIAGSSFNIVGGTTAAARNVISGNAAANVLVSGVASQDNVVEGNYIGTNVAGTGPFPNQGDGVLISIGAANNTIGGTAPGAGNTIAYDRKGVVITGSDTTGNRILGNAIFANAGPGIDLGDDGVTLNVSTG